MSKVPSSLFTKLGQALGVISLPMPKSTLGKVGVGAASLVGPPLLLNLAVKGAKELRNKATDRPYWQAREYQEELRRQEIIRQEQQRKLDEAIARNTMMLAQTSPQLFAELSAGRRLPKNATPIGGQPRTDIISEVARRMSTGELAGGGQGGLDGLLQ